MKSTITALVAIFAISSIGIWGCAQQRNNAQARKIRDLEGRYVKLEEDYRAGLARDEATRKKLAALEVLHGEMTQQLEEMKVAAQERDELKQKLATRTAERDTAQQQLVQFSKELQTFASRVETIASAGSGIQGAPVGVSPKTN